MFSPRYKQSLSQPTSNIEPIIDDTTLRDGVQTPGVALSPKEAMEVALFLDQIGVQRIELHHFQLQDRRAVKLIQDASLKARLAGWCRAVRDDVDSAIACDLEDIGISHPVSKIHLEAKWPNKSEKELLDRVQVVVEYAAKDQGLTVFVHGEDSTRADWNFEKAFIATCTEAGATTYRICDTLGVGNPRSDGSLPNGIPEKVRMIRLSTKIPYIEIHAHNDLGNALANTMAAINAASGYFDKIYASTTLLGIGERSGNAKTEEVIMNLYYHYGVTKFKKGLHKLTEASRYLSRVTNTPIAMNHPIVGSNAFAHESGVHTHGVLRNPLTYEPFPPELVGNSRRLTVGKHSGRSIIRHKIVMITGREDVDGGLLDAVVGKVREIYQNGRRTSLDDREIKTLIRCAETGGETP